MAHSCESYFMKLGFMKLAVDTENATMDMCIKGNTVLCEPSSSAAWLWNVLFMITSKALQSVYIVTWSSVKKKKTLSSTTNTSVHPSMSQFKNTNIINTLIRPA